MDDLRVYTQELETTMRRPDSAGRVHVLIVAETVHRLRIGVYLAFDERQG
jgi:hypothetical protein